MASTKRVDERNEKIIRGLMKLPPNRRCINCNGLGPQYVCTNFWTFVCVTCSGIHREFTHRVKSVSMSKFTTQEVDALQKGGNQRAKEIYLKDWDLQKQRLPDISNVDMIRQFIKNVYVDRRYAGGKNSAKPPRDMQGHINSENETRRASSYHSYSQSPPYDYQYEERLNRRQAATLTRRPGSDRGLYEGKISSFASSPGCSSDHNFEDVYGNEGSNARPSDYSASSPGELVRSSPQSPNSLKEFGISSPIKDAHGKICADRVPIPQRTVSAGSLRSMGDSAETLKSANSGSFDAFPGPCESAVGHHMKNTTVSSSLQLPASGNSAGLDLFKDSFSVQPSSSASSTDLFQTLIASPVAPVDIDPPPANLLASSGTVYSSHVPCSSLSFFDEACEKPSAANEKLSETSVPNSAGWATFDLPQLFTPCHNSQSFTTGEVHSSMANSFEFFSPKLPSNANTRWPEFPVSVGGGPCLVESSSWHDNLHVIQCSTDAPSSQSWEAFQDYNTQQEVQGNSDFSISQDKPSMAGSFVASTLSAVKDSSKTGFGEVGSHETGSFAAFQSHETSESLLNQSVSLFMGEMGQHIEHKPCNPFDIPYDLDLQDSSALMDMSSLQATLPSMQLPSPFVGDLDEPWLPPSTANPCIPNAAQGGLLFMAAPASSPPIQNIQTQGPFASVSGCLLVSCTLYHRIFLLAAGNFYVTHILPSCNSGDEVNAACLSTTH